MHNHQMEHSNQENNGVAKLFIKRLLISFAAMSLAIFVWKRSDIFPWIGGCNPKGYTNDNFMSYCHSSRFGDLEHNIYWHNLEPGLIENVQNADILFLGNSRTQYAFSTTAVSNYFDEKDYSHYIFGFGMGSQNSVPEMLADKYSLTPKALIINADPFFTNRISGTNQAMLEETWSRRWELNTKRFLAHQQEESCTSSDSGFLHSLMCLGTEETLYRRIKDGHWEVRYFRKNKQIPTAIDNLQNMGVTVEEARVIADNFIAKFEVEKQCVILTVTPRTQTPLAFAEQLAKDLGVIGIFPNPGNLVTVDDSHLDPQSALRWSSALLKEVGPILDSCARN